MSQNQKYIKKTHHDGKLRTASDITPIATKNNWESNWNDLTNQLGSAVSAGLDVLKDFAGVIVGTDEQNESHLSSNASNAKTKRSNAQTTSKPFDHKLDISPDSVSHFDLANLAGEANKLLFYILKQQRNAHKRKISFRDLIILLGNTTDFVYNLYSLLSNPSIHSTSNQETSSNHSNNTNNNSDQANAAIMHEKRKRIENITRDISLITLKLLLIYFQSTNLSLLSGKSYASWIFSYLIENYMSHISGKSPASIIFNATSSSLTPWSSLIASLTQSSKSQGIFNQNNSKMPVSTATILQNLELAVKTFSLLRRMTKKKDDQKQKTSKTSNGTKSASKLKYIRDLFILQTVVGLTALAGGAISSQFGSKPKSNL